MSEIISQLFRKPEEDFEHHLSLANNERILFSGKFGMGKTTFLKWYFDKEEPQNKYNCINLFPVNYSIASNEDIFKYIKYDIIIELLTSEHYLPDINDNIGSELLSFFKGNGEKMATSIVKMIPEVGKPLIEVYETIKPLLLKLAKLAHNEAKNEADPLVDYLTNIENSEGNIFENDLITKLIEKFLSTSWKSTGKRNILIIDDLDRIDPEHIFRLLNVFAAHFDRRIGSANKFGFDKIILVCDIANIRQIFKSKYGIDTDFNGYIDKFYSITPFHFDHSDFYPRFIIDSARDFKFFENYPYSAYIDEASEELIRIFAKSGFFDLRQILQWKKRRLKYKPNYIIDQQYSVKNEEFPIITAIQFIKEILGDVGALKETISKLSKDAVRIQYEPMTIICGVMLRLIYSDKGPNYLVKSNYRIRYKYQGNEAVEFAYQEMHNPKLAFIIQTNGTGNRYQITLAYFIDIFLQTVNFMIEHRML